MEGAHCGRVKQIFLKVGQIEMYTVMNVTSNLIGCSKLGQTVAFSYTAFCSLGSVEVLCIFSNEDSDSLVVLNKLLQCLRDNDSNGDGDSIILKKCLGDSDLHISSYMVEKVTLVCDFFRVYFPPLCRRTTIRCKKLKGSIWN